MPPSATQKEAVRHVLRALRGRSTPKPCVYLLIGWIVHVVPPADHRTPFDDTEMTTLADRLSDITVEWVTRIRSLTELEDALNMECHCSTQESREEAHVRGKSLYMREGGPGGDDHPKWYLMALLFQPFRHYEVNQTQAHRSDVALRLDQLHRRPEWPRALKSLLPYGVANTVRGLVQWFQLDLNPRHRVAIYMGLDVIMIFCHHLVLPYLVTSRPFLELGIVQAMRSDRLRLETLSSEDNSIADHVEVMFCLDAMMKLMRLLALESSCGVERMIFHQLNPRRALQGYEDALVICQHLDRFSRLPNPKRRRGIGLFSTAQVTQIVKNLHELGGKLFVDCSSLMKLASNPTQVIFCRTAQSVMLPQPVDVWQQFVGTVAVMEFGQRCAYPKCQHTMASTILQRCNGCSIVLYCSRKCQKRAWTLEDAPHRTICRTMRFACERYRPQMQSGSPPYACVPPDFNVLEAQEIVRHYQTLTAIMMDTLGKSDDLRYQRTSLIAILFYKDLVGWMD
jgi:hypothetical protein